MSPEWWSSALGSFSWSLPLQKLIIIPVHCQLRRFMDSNKNVQSKIRWNFHSSCEYPIPFGTSARNSQLDNFVNIYYYKDIVNKYIGSSIVSEISGQFIANQNCLTFISRNVLDHWRAFGQFSSGADSSLLLSSLPFSSSLIVYSSTESLPLLKCRHRSN